MQKSKIEWTDWTWNPITGCTLGCPYCYARKMAENPFYAKSFPHKFKPTLHADRLRQMELSKLKAGDKVFVCSMGELFGEHEDWTRQVLEVIKQHPWVTFQLLTKQPQNLIKYSPFPDNCWIGVSVTSSSSYLGAMHWIPIIKAPVKFISFEPLLEYPFNQANAKIKLINSENLLKLVDWLIIGQQTPVKISTMPKVGWIEEIVNAADKASIPVFLKDNLISCVDQYPFAFTGKFPDLKYRQEFPL